MDIDLYPLDSLCPSNNKTGRKEIEKRIGLFRVPNLGHAREKPFRSLKRFLNRWKLGICLLLGCYTVLTFEGWTDRLSRNVANYQSTLRNIPEERTSRLHRGGSLRSRKWTLLSAMFVRNSKWEFLYLASVCLRASWGVLLRDQHYFERTCEAGKACSVPQLTAEM